MKASSGAGRHVFRDGSFAAHVRRLSPAAGAVRSDDELEQSLRETMAKHPAHDEVLVFAYGSLMWNPAIEHSRMSAAVVHGWHRRLCLRLCFGRGSAERPGLMLALDRGGACSGGVLHIPAASAMTELKVLWQREMLTGAYDARWVMAHTSDGPRRALTFVANRKHPRYAGTLTDRQVADFVTTGVGELGTCRVYFDATCDALKQLRVTDAGLDRIRRLMQRD